MAIPESQLDTWSHQGSITQSSGTYQSIKLALDSTDSAFANKSYTIFLQGSYGNDTNIYAESDVDIIIQLNSCFYYDTTALPSDQATAFNSTYPNSVNYGYPEFKKDVLSLLKNKYGDLAKQGNKAIKIEASGSRRSADVIVSAEYRRYHEFTNTYNSFDSGICFYNNEGVLIANYPKQHSMNCTEKHQATRGWFKPMVRILKNLRGKLVDEKMITSDTAPSYYIEGLLYNVPDENFGSSYVASFENCINWILKANRSEFVCPNKQYYLLRDNSLVTWQDSKCTQFLTAACDLWNQW
jgi:hypothetical protein